MPRPEWLDALARDDLGELRTLVGRPFLVTEDLAVSTTPATKGHVIARWDDRAGDATDLIRLGRRFRCARVSDGYEDVSHINPAALVLAADDGEMPDTVVLWANSGSPVAMIRALCSLDLGHASTSERRLLRRTDAG